MSTLFFSNKRNYIMALSVLSLFVHGCSPDGAVNRSEDKSSKASNVTDVAPLSAVGTPNVGEIIFELNANDFAYSDANATGTNIKAHIFSDSGVFALGSPIKARCVPYKDTSGNFRIIDGLGPNKLGTVIDSCPSGNTEAVVVRGAAAFPVGQPFVVTRNLGVDYDQLPSNPPNYMRVFPTLDGLRWVFDSRMLPSGMRVNIPGSGIHTQVGKQYGVNSPIVSPIDNTHFIEVSAQMKLPAFSMFDAAGKLLTEFVSTNAVSQIGMSVDFYTVDANGANVAFNVNIGFVHPAAADWTENGITEKVASDGRNTFLGTFLTTNPTRQYITVASDQMMSTSFDYTKTFSFKITKNNLLAIIGGYNSKRGGETTLPLLSTDLSRVKLGGVVLRNEHSRFTSQTNGQKSGDVKVLVELHSIIITKKTVPTP